MVDEKDSAEDYSKRWVETINRGGLLFACKELYELIKATGLKVWLVLNKTFPVNYCGQNVNSIIFPKLNTSEEINRFKVGNIEKSHE